MQLQTLPEQPIVTIEPRRSWVELRLEDIWAYRELLYFLTWRDVKVRYKQTALGAAWAVIQPLFMMIIFAFAFGKLVRVPTDGVPAPLFYYVAIMPWTFFSNALASSSNSLIANSNLITKVYFPRMIIPFAAVGSGLLDFGIAFVLLLGLMPYYGMAISWQIVMLPVLIVLTTLLASAFGLCMSALSVIYRDVRHALPFIIQLWMFATPIIYPLSLVPGKWRWLIRFNPLSGLIEGYRASLFGLPFDWIGLSFSAGLTLICFYAFGRVFRHMEKIFADVI
ncbi:MAG: ABC transporter permease [Acidobacteriia bacterium]|nr:ABC transporter permease [Terriglobia bacterium]